MILYAVQTMGWGLLEMTGGFFMVGGQALVSMPLMTPLADLLDVSRQISVLACTLGDGLSNMIMPTSGFLMAILGLAEIPYENWVRFMWPLFLLLSFAGLIIIGIAVYTGY